MNKIFFIVIILIITLFTYTTISQSTSSEVEECPESPYYDNPPVDPENAYNGLIYAKDLSSTEKEFHERYMRIALDKAIQHNSKFGAAIVHKNGTLMCTAANTGDGSRILHGEIRAILNCSELYQQTTWEDYYMYTTGEPCPMCSAALLWTKFEKVIFGTFISNMYCERCFSQLPMDADRIFRLGYGINHNAVLIGGILESQTDLLIPSVCNTGSVFSITPFCQAGWSRDCPVNNIFSDSSDF
ncbi:hypothetical protein RB653_010235 [Dictyostelium firmibasis]|uniref:CMP/dCMP-type deaminase domain-containing protein n=1 Tax=Dictyostelium firmibasis TaxID=79012 RepID=A0AAN7TZ01_9MYCE